jgi:hypothetical protein
MTELDLAHQQMRVARSLIANFSFIDPTLWPILSEIDTALIRGLPSEHRVRRLPDRRQARTDVRTEASPHPAGRPREAADERGE